MDDHAGGGCCHHEHKHADEHPPGHHHGGHGGNLVRTAAHATVHCLTGCVIGEILGLAIGVHFAIGMWPTMILSTVLAYVIGMSLATNSVMRREKLAFVRALRTVMLGEVVSIGVMEIVMNTVDYMVGGVGANSLTSPIFYIGLAAAIPAGFFAAWPVNYWLLKHEIKGKCH